MTINYKVGDSIRILDASGISCGFDLTNGNTYEINQVSDSGSLYIYLMTYLMKCVSRLLN